MLFSLILAFWTLPHLTFSHTQLSFPQLFFSRAIQLRLFHQQFQQIPQLLQTRLYHPTFIIVLIVREFIYHDLKTRFVLIFILSARLKKVKKLEIKHEIKTEKLKKYIKIEKCIYL